MTEKKNVGLPTLSEEDITTTRHMSRRSFLASTRMGVGLGVASAVFGAGMLATPAHASDRENQTDTDPANQDHAGQTDND
ncbi:hypothetical protein [Magnetospirillum sulfuroxidans]|uniref:Secreted protein n=1 Tax=Magnetospirillum sulfuroxidans TaxID=611300 RepID=A0ABS5I9E9_9PROT|nr:hypothetical protein [Magnetospirillum sulfuroxidans]MBR9971057.1 hypothetical protein [Magnetospirillum sulfuroxidans]